MGRENIPIATSTEPPSIFFLETLALYATRINATAHDHGICPMKSSIDVTNRVVSSRGGDGDAAAILALSGGGGRDKNVAVLAAVLGVSLAGALAFAYTRPADNKWWVCPFLSCCLIP